RGDQSHWTMEARYARDLTRALHAEVHARYLSNRFNGAASGFNGTVADAGLDLRWDGWKKQSWLFAASYGDGEIESARSTRPPPPGAPPGPPITLTLKDRSRESFGVTLQDSIDLTQKLAVTAGARFDRLTDTDERITPRLALVWRVNENHILKLQYAEGFRAPTFFELYSNGARNPNLGFEVNGTTELSYVYRRATTVGRATLFTSKIRDMIFVGPGNVFDNTHQARAYGAELEVEQQFGPSLKLQANASWVDSETDRNATATSIAPSPLARLLGNLSVLYRADARTLIAGRWNHVGSRNAATGDNKGFDPVDLTVTRNDLFIPGLQLRAGIKNVFDADIRYFLENASTTEALTYPGRTYFAQLSWRP
ncbi:MAG: TonB-dependent receptor, partial [Thermoanaerobaculia bacterium]